VKKQNGKTGVGGGGHTFMCTTLVQEHLQTAGSVV